MKASAVRLLRPPEEPTPGTVSSDAEIAAFLDAFVAAARHRGLELSASELLEEHRHYGRVGSALLARLAERCGIRAKFATLSPHDLTKLGTALPVVLVLNNGECLVLLGCEEKDRVVRLLLEDPEGGERTPVTLDEYWLEQVWSGKTVFLKRDFRAGDEEAPFGTHWIFGELLKDRRACFDITVAAIILGIIALVPILFLRLVIDRVLPHRSLNTLAVLTIYFALFLCFEAVFFLRAPTAGSALHDPT